MSSVRQKKLMWVLATLIGTIIAVTLIIYAIREQTDFYFDPSMIVAGEAPQNKRIRAGGIIVAGSVKRQADNPLNVRFKITDCQSTVSVQYEGILPDLFAENSGIVATGMLNDDVFIATEVLAKHDENYMPPEVSKSMKVDSKDGVNKALNDVCAVSLTKSLTTNPVGKKTD